jgi:hypothetical protein
VLSLAEEHHVLPLLYWNAAALDHEVPEPVMHTLAGAFRANAEWNLRLTGELLRVVAAARAAGLRLIAWKGPGLALAAYGHLGLRTFSDLDLLVEPRDLDAATHALLELGLQLEDTQPDLRVRTFSGVDAPLVELHWAPLPWWFASDLGVSSLHWADVAIGDGLVPHLSPTDLLVTLCAHGIKHRWHRLQWIADVAGLIRRHDLDWRRAADVAQRTGTYRALQTGLALVRGVLGTELSADAAHLADGDASTGAYARQLADQLFNESWPPRGTGQVRYRTMQWQLKERWRDRLRYAAGATVGRVWCNLHAVKRPGARVRPAMRRVT